MFALSSRRICALLLATGTLGMAAVGACAEKKGALMLAINTDMKAPKDVNAVSVTISTNGAIKHSFIGRVTPQGEVLLPATLAVVEPEDKSASIRIRVLAFQDRKPRVLRDVRTTIPSGGRTALLRIPLNFVNTTMPPQGPDLPNGVVPDPLPGTATSGGSSSGTSGTSGIGGGDPGAVNPGAADFDFFGAFQPPCPDIQNQTIIEGECKDSFIDPETLPDFDAELVGNSTEPGQCFDIVKCLGSAMPIAQQGTTETRDPVPPGEDGSGGGSALPDAGAGKMNIQPRTVTLENGCVLQLNGADASRLNLALVTPDTGECVRPGECYVPLDRGAGGWKEEGGRVQLPLFVCKLLTGKGLRLVHSEGACAAKEELNPICTPKAGDVPSPITDGSVNVTGPRRMIAEDFPTTVVGLPDGKVYLAGKSGLVVYPSVPSDGTLAAGAQKLLPGDGTDAPRFFQFSLQDLTSFVMVEGSRAYVVRGGAAPQVVAFGAQVLGFAEDAEDFIFSTAERNGDAVFRLAKQGADAPQLRGVFNPTGKLITSIIGLEDSATAQPAGFVMGFEDGRVGTCAVTGRCDELAISPSLPGIGRIDLIAGTRLDPNFAPSTFALFQHTQGISRMDANGATLVPTHLVTADLNGFTSAGRYYRRGFITDGKSCVIFSDSQNRVRFRHITTQTEGTLYTGTSPVLDVTSVKIGGEGGTSFVLWSVFATSSEQGGIWGAPLPDMCKPSGVKTDSGVPDSGGSDADAQVQIACPSAAPINAAALPWKTPAVSAGSCTQAELDDLVTYVQANPAGTYAQWKASIVDPACANCIFAPEANASWSPLLENAVGGRPNVGGCIALQTNNACGKAYQNLHECALEACKGCPAGDAQALQMCRSNSTAPGKPCSTALATRDADCGAALPNAEVACAGATFIFEGPVKFQCIGGPL
jgi:hypothetical protein